MPLLGKALPADEEITCTVLADSSHGDSHVGSVSPAATRTRTLALTLTLTRTRTLTLALTLTLIRTLTLTLTLTRVHARFAPDHAGEDFFELLKVEA